MGPRPRRRERGIAAGFSAPAPRSITSPAVSQTAAAIDFAPLRHASPGYLATRIRTRVGDLATPRQLEADMNTLKAKLSEAKLKLKDMMRKDSPAASSARPEARLSPGERKIRQAMGRFDRLQSQVERLEARVRSYEVGGLAPAAWDAANEPGDPAIEEELDALKARVSGQAKAKAAASTELPEPREA